MILTQTSRAKFLRRLLDVLDPQVAKFPDVHVDVRMFDRTLSLGENREVMRQDSMGDYIGFCDDDDLVPEDYVETILPLLDGVDYIGHRIQFYLNGALDRPIFHSLQYHGWTTVDGIHYRDISHVHPMRRELALLEPMEGGVAEDFRWAARMRARDVVKTEHYIDRAMYFYYFRTNKDERPGPPQLMEKDARLEEVELSSLQLDWIYSVHDFLKIRREVIAGLETKVATKDTRLDEIKQLEKFDDFPVRKYIEKRRIEIAGL
jgi:hypothetical protein